MTSVTITPDDSGVQRLRHDSEKPASVQHVAGTTATKAIDNARHEDRVAPVISRKREFTERRHKQRRTRQGKTLLDTRSHRERRRQPNSPDKNLAITQRIDIRV